MGKKAKIVYSIIGVILVGLLIFGGYKFYQSKIVIEKFSSYIDSYKKELGMYDLIDKENEYIEIVTESEQALSEKNYRKIPDLKERAELLKEELLGKNIEIAEEKIKQLESIDISNLDNKDSINSSIEELKRLKESHNFVKVNQICSSLSEEINVKLLEIEKQKKKEELLNNIDGLYRYERLNKNGVALNRVDITLISYNENKLSISGGYNSVVIPGTDLNEATDADIRSYRSGSIGGELYYVDNLKWSGYIWDDGFPPNEFEISRLDFPTIPITISIDDNGSIITTVNEESYIKGNYTFLKCSDEEAVEYGVKIQDEKIRLEEGPKITLREAYDLINEHGNPPEEYDYLGIFDDIMRIDMGMWPDFPEGEYYHFEFSETGTFLVNKESGLVYSLPEQVGYPIHLMKNGKIEKSYEFIE